MERARIGVGGDEDLAGLLPEAFGIIAKPERESNA